MKDALGQRLKSEIFNVFLNLHTGNATCPAGRAANSQLASAGAPRGAKRVAALVRATATQVEVHARREVPAEVAALTEPVVEVAELAPEPARVEAPAFRFELHDPKLMRGQELAMIIPPDMDVMAPPPPRPARREAARRATALRRRAAELETHTAAFNVEFKDATEIKGISPVELRRQLDSIQTLRFNDDNTARTWTKLLKLKRAAPKPAPAPAARASCPETSASDAPARPVVCGPTAVEAFYTSE